MVIAIAVSVIALSAAYAAWTYGNSACTVTAGEWTSGGKELVESQPASCVGFWRK